MLRPGMYVEDIIVPEIPYNQGMYTYMVGRENLPRFDIKESWEHNSADLLFTFYEEIPHPVWDMVEQQVGNELKDQIRGRQTVYHADQIANETIAMFVHHGYLRKSPITNKWVLSRGNYGEDRYSNDNLPQYRKT